MGASRDGARMLESQNLEREGKISKLKLVLNVMLSVF
jgi:hypothetical protein